MDDDNDKVEDNNKVDSRFIYPKEPIRQYENQNIQRFDWSLEKPVSQWPTRYEFDLPCHELDDIQFGPMTGFEVTGTFLCKPNAAAPDTDFETIPPDDYQNVQLIPNWFEHCIKSVDVMQGHQIIRTFDAPRIGELYLNTYLYSGMDSSLKKRAFPQQNNPAYSVPTRLNGWTMDENSEWHMYSKEVFGKQNVQFQYIPSFVFPFYQPSDYEQIDRERNEPTILPMKILYRPKVVLYLTENFDHIFKKSENNEKVYRFQIESIKLGLEHVTLRKAFKDSWMMQLKQQKVLGFPGVTKIAKVVNIAPGLLYHKFKFDSVQMPDGIFIFALPKSVERGEKYNAGNPIFAKHNIKTVEVRFGGHRLVAKSPNYGDILDHMTVVRKLIEHCERPPFGIPQDPSYLVFENFKDGSENTLFPHVYINLCVSKDGSRVIPLNDDGKIINNQNVLDVALTFNSNGAAQNATYFAYIFYTDVCMLLNLKEGQFEPCYGHRQRIM